VRPVLPAARTKLIQLQAVRIVSPVLGGCVVSFPTFRAGKVNDLAIFFLCHNLLDNLGDDTGADGPPAFPDGEV
jgi:hypothetical protein